MFEFACLGPDSLHHITHCNEVLYIVNESVNVWRWSCRWWHLVPINFIFFTLSCSTCGCCPLCRPDWLLPIPTTGGTVDFSCIIKSLSFKKLFIYGCFYECYSTVSKTTDILVIERINGAENKMLNCRSSSICGLFYLCAEISLLSCHHLHHFACSIELDWLHLQEGDGQHKKAADGWSEVKSKHRMHANPRLAPPFIRVCWRNRNNYTRLQTGVYVKAIRRDWTQVTSKWWSQVSFRFAY